MTAHTPKPSRQERAKTTDAGKSVPQATGTKSVADHRQVPAHADGAHPPAWYGDGADHRVGLLRDMLLIRRFEERCAELYSSGRIRGFVHLCIGEEAVSVGVHRALTSEDSVVTTYREHGHALARGLPVESVFAEMLGRVTGCSRGRGGSMHLFDTSRRFYGGHAIVAGGLPMATGLALAERMRGQDRQGRLTCCLFGDGAMAEGEFHETANLAALWDLPLLLVCENNLYAMGTPLTREHAQIDLAARAASYGMPAWAVDGMDVLAVERTTRKAARAVRDGGGPLFLEMRTYRFRAHSMYDPDLYRDKAEIEHWKKRDPIALLLNRMRTEDGFTDTDEEHLEKKVVRQLDQALALAEEGELESVSDLLRFVHTPAEGVS